MNQTNQNENGIDLADVLGEPEDGPVIVGGVAYPIYALRMRDYGKIQRITGEADLSLGALDGMVAVAYCNMLRTNPGLDIDTVDAMFSIKDEASLLAMTTMFARVMRASGMTSPEQGAGAGAAKKEPEAAKPKASKSTASES